MAAANSATTKGKDDERHEAKLDKMVSRANRPGLTTLKF